MNVYDFDGTIYDGDSTKDFYFYCVKQYPDVLRAVPSQISGVILYILHKIDKTRFKEKFYTFLRYIPDIDKAVENFWSSHESNIKAFYKEQHENSDVVISASPEFLLAPICKKLSINTLIASQVVKNTGKYVGVNCRCKEKIKRFYEIYPEGVIDNFYTDSKSDRPLAEIAKKSYMVKGNEVKEWVVQ